jgi:glycosyltransferase involved in cell wall biosynthesis
MSKYKILVTGIISSPDAINQRTYANVPGSLWLKGFCQGLKANGAKLELISHVPDRLFPYGELVPRNKLYLDEEFHTNHILYPNLPMLRTPALRIQYLIMSKKHFLKTHFDYVISYNPSPQHVAVGRWATKNTNAKWISVLLDPPEQNFDGDWNRYRNTYGPATVDVHLSWKSYVDFPGISKFHLDAGAETEVSCNKILFKDKPFKVLYSGKLEPTYGGSGLFLEFFKNCSSPDFQFILCGRVHDLRILEYAKTDSRILIKGFVSDTELNILCKDADAFFNIRDPHHVDNPYIFPSKLLFYLKYNKPIFSLHTPGIAPHYHDLMYFPEENTPLGLSQLVENFTNKYFQDWPLRKIRISNYLSHEGTWKSKTHALLAFCQSL